MVEWQSYKCIRDVRSSFVGESKACVETPEMLEFNQIKTKVEGHISFPTCFVHPHRV